MPIPKALAGGLALLLAAACAAPIAGPAAIGPMRRLDAIAPRGPLTLAMYNVRNLFDRPVITADGAITKPKPEKDRVALGQSLHLINADVVALAEVDSLPTLTAFRDRHVADMGYQYLALVEGNDQRGIDVAVMSRLPITGVASHKDVTFPVPGVAEPQKLSRDLLQVALRTGGGYAFTLFVAHLKSHYGGPPSDVRRLAEAQAVRRLVSDYEQAHPNSNYALCGDMNDAPETPPLRALLGADDPTLRLFDALAEIGSWAYTYFIPKYRSRIDYLLLSRGMANEYVAGSARIWKGPEFFRASDHLPATIRLDTAREAVGPQPPALPTLPPAAPMPPSLPPQPDLPPPEPEPTTAAPQPGPSAPPAAPTARRRA